MSVRDIPSVGNEVILSYTDDTPADELRVVESYGAARLMLVRDTTTGDYGVVAFQPNGSWWWVRQIDRREPWASDDDAWRS